MGIRGLTKFIEKSQFLEKYELHDTKLVIEGDSVSRQLHKIHSEHGNGCFEGDYDRFADYVNSFFKMLDDCRITPYVVFDGGAYNLNSKLKKISGRLEKIKDILNDLSNENREIYFPLLMRDVFQDTVKKLKISIVRCDTLSFGAVVSIAKYLNCPILSYDSEYFLRSEITYIPFRSLCRSVEKPYPRIFRHITTDKTVIKYIPCEKFNVNSFLRYLEITADKLPLVAVMLGGDNSEYPNYWDLGNKIINFEERLLKIASWIADRSIECAMEDFLTLAENTPSRIKLQQSFEYFKRLDDTYLPIFGICSNQELSDNRIYLEHETRIGGIPTVFLENFRKWRYSPDLMNIYMHNEYYGFKPQVEDFHLPHSHVICEKIASAFQKILTNSKSKLRCVVREGDILSTKEIPHCEIDVPSFIEIQGMEVEARRSAVLRILEMDFMQNALQQFPISWHLFVITILYYLKNLPFVTWPLCCSLTLCRTIFSYVDTKNVRLFHFLKFNYNAKPAHQNSYAPLEMDEKGDNFLILQEMEHFVEYFQMKDDVRIPYDVSLVHGMSQFQSCLLHIKILNDLFNMPFQDLIIPDCFNGTFIYNFSKKLEQSPKIEDFVEDFLRQNKTPRIMDDFQKMMVRIRNIVNM